METGGKKVASGNAALSMALTDWCFKQSGVLKVESISHHKAGEKSPPAHYTIKDDAVYTIVVKELVKGQWVPYDGKDMQMEFVRIHPFVRVTMENKAGHMIAKFKVLLKRSVTQRHVILYASRSLTHMECTSSR